MEQLKGYKQTKEHINNRIKSRNIWNKILTKRFLIKEYIKNKKSSTQNAKEVGCNAQTVHNYLIKNKIKIRTQSESAKISSKLRIKNRRSYKGKENPAWKGNKAIKRQIHFCKNTNCNNKICYSNWKYGNRLCKKCANDGDNNPMFGKHLTEEHRKKMSDKLKGVKRPYQSKRQKGNKNSMFGKVTHGKWGKYKEIYMRSSYEIKFAQFLDLSGYEWQYEPKTFDLGNMTYTPDFYIPEWDCYIEIKGWWREDAKRKFKKFKKTYPKIRIKVLMKPELQELGVLK